MAVVSVSMPATLLDRIDTVAEKHGYTGRSEVVRDASRTLLNELEGVDGGSGAVVGTVTVLLAGNARDDGLSELPAEYEEVLVGTVESEVSDGHQLAHFVLDGDFDDIAAFVERVRSLRGALTVDHSVQPIEALAPTH